MGKFGFKWINRLAKSLGVVAVLGGLQATALSVAMAAPPNGRMPPEERHRLRQEVRQHSGGHMRQPMQAVPVPNSLPNPLPSSGVPPMVIPQNSSPVVGRLPPYAPPVPPGNTAYPGGRTDSPAGGRLSEDDRRALRQQLREQHRIQREPVGGS